MDNVSLDEIPTEIISEIIQYLSRQDRLSCSLVCRKWKDALNRKDLWKTLVLKIDKDFLEPSTILLTEEYSRYVDALEFGWEYPHLQNRWLPMKVQDLTKRVVRFLIILHENCVQINSLRIFEWYDSFPFKKLVYHFSRFLKLQKGLKRLVLNNTNLPKTECLKILGACLESKNSITHLEISNYYYNFNTAFDTMEFQDIFKQFAYLKELKLDYFIFSSTNIIDIVAESPQKPLRLLEIFFDETDLHSVIIPERKWHKLKAAYPRLKISFFIRNICHHDQIKFILLMRSVPLNCFSLVSNNKFDQKFSRNFEVTLTRLVEIFQNTLEYINLDLKNNKENLDSLLFNIIVRCPNLKSLFFDGIVNESMDVFRQICQYRKSAKGLKVKLKPHKFKSVLNIIHLFS